MSKEKHTKKYRQYGTILYHFLQIVRKTLKIKFIKDESIDMDQENYIYAFWHNKLVASTICLDKVKKRAVLASPSKDGELISVPLEKLGFEIVRGSSDKNSTSSLISLIKLIKKGYSIGTPVDGPKGPIYEVKPGLVYLAQKCKKKIIPTGTAYSKKIEIKKAWDRFQFPKPFSKVVYILGKPIEIPQGEDIDKYCEIIKDELNRLDSLAQSYLEKF